MARRNPWHLSTALTGTGSKLSYLDPEAVDKAGTQRVELVITGILHSLATGAPFAELEPYGNPRTLETRFERWSQDGTAVPATRSRSRASPTARGSPERDRALGLRRADAARAYLASLGMARRRACAPRPSGLRSSAPRARLQRRLVQRPRTGAYVHRARGARKGI